MLVSSVETAVKADTTPGNKQLLEVQPQELMFGMRASPHAHILAH